MSTARGCWQMTIAEMVIGVIATVRRVSRWADLGTQPKSAGESTVIETACLPPGASGRLPANQSSP